MKNSAKNRSQPESYSASEAAELLGISIPTLKWMVAGGRLESFRTPGGHLRVLAERLEALRDGRKVQPSRVRDASPVLQNRRERLEELTLEAQEMRARRELAKLRLDEQGESERQEAESQAREEAAAERHAELELERERLKHEQAQARLRTETEREQERLRREVEQRLAAFRCRWLEKANQAISAYEYRWLSAGQRKEILEGLESEITKRHPADEPRMGAIIDHSLEALAEPFRVERDAQEMRQRLTERALKNLPCSATEAERMRAAAAIRKALLAFDGSADKCEMHIAAEEAVRPIRQATERRALEEQLISWAIRALPWSKTEGDEARLRRDCAEILAEMPVDVSELEAKEALEPTVREACHDIEERRRERERQAHKASLVQQGLSEVSSYLLELKCQDEISADEYWDSDFVADLRNNVKSELEAELAGDETIKQTRELVQEIIDEELS
jgi:excisionase family DNA binding protein